MSFRVLTGQAAASQGYANSLIVPDYSGFMLNGSSIVGPNHFAWTNAPVLNSADPVVTGGTGADIITAVANTVCALNAWSNAFSQTQSAVDLWSASGTFSYDTSPPDAGYTITQIDAITYQVPLKLLEFANYTTNHNGTIGGFSGLNSTGPQFEPVGGQALPFPLVGAQIGALQSVFLYVQAGAAPVTGLLQNIPIFPIGLPCRRFNPCNPWEG